MTEAELDKLSELERRCPRGPWFWKQGYEMSYRVDEDEEDQAGYDLGDNIETREHWAIYSADSEAEGRVVSHHLVSLSSGAAHGTCGFLDCPDVQLVVAARNALPELLRLARLGLEVEALDQRIIDAGPAAVLAAAGGKAEG